MTTALLVVAILVLLIVTHELGHFIAAKFFGVRVDEFGVGYPPRAFLFGKIGDTEYTFNWIPFGGFVRLFGESGEAIGQERSFAHATKWKQALILIAGVLANALVAWMLFVTALHVGVPRIIDAPSPGQIVQLIVSDVVPGSPADAGGLIVGDEIINVRSAKGEQPKELSPDGIVDFVKGRGGQPLSVTYIRAHGENTVVMRPANAVVPGAADRPALGVGLVMVGNESLGVGEAVYQGFWTTLNAFQYVGGSLWTIVSGSVRGTADLSQVVGPVGLVGVIGEASRSGAGYVLELAAFIAVNLAIINLVPIPALDGGRLLIIGIEAIMRRPPPRLIMKVVNAVGIALVIFLMITVTYNDIVRLLI